MSKRFGHLVFNDNHKATFRLNQVGSWSKVSYDLTEISKSLVNVKIIDVCIQDEGYDYNSQYKKIPLKFKRIYRWQFSKNKIKKAFGRFIYQLLYARYYLDSSYESGFPID